MVAWGFLRKWKIAKVSISALSYNCIVFCILLWPHSPHPLRCSLGWKMTKMSFIPVPLRIIFNQAVNCRKAKCFPVFKFAGTLPSREVTFIRLIGKHGVLFKWNHPLWNQSSAEVHYQWHWYWNNHEDPIPCFCCPWLTHTNSKVLFCFSSESFQGWENNSQEHK